MKLKFLSFLLLILSVSTFEGFSQSINLELNPALKNQMSITESPIGTFDITTSGIDPWVQTKPVATYNPDSVFVIIFEYLAPNGLDDLEIFYGTPVSAARTVKLGSLPKTTAFTSYKVLMKFGAPTWNAFYDRFRFDFGKKAGQNIKVRNVLIRSALPTEVINLDFNLNLKNQMNITKKADNSYDINTTGVDPWVVAKINTTFNPEKVFVIGFDYIATAGLDDLEIFYGTPFTASKKATLGGLSATATYKNFKTLMRVSAPVWDESYNQVRFDFGKQAGQTLNVKNIVLREATAEEYAAFDVKDSVSIKFDVTKTSSSLSATLLPDGSYKLNTSANDPWIQSLPITDLYNISETYIISFDYKTDTAYNDLEIFYGPPIGSTQASSFGALPAAPNWTSFAINPRLSVDNFQDAIRTLFRFDFGKNEGQSKTIYVKNLQIRKPTPQELADEQQSDKFLSVKLNNDFLAYLDKSFTDSIALVKIDTATVNIKGTINATESEYFLAELEPHHYDFDINNFSSISPLTIDSGKFSVSLPRFVAKTDRNYDRLYSRWAVVKKISDNNYSLLSNPTWAGDISAIAKYNLPEKKATTKKGLDGLGGSTFQYFSELPELGIKSMKINILLNGVFSLNPTPLVHNFNGKIYYINPNFINQFDNSIKACTDNDILVSLVVLIPINIGNETLKRIFDHPDATKGLYSMANVATEEGVEYYTAMIDFLAQRYSKPDNQYGRVDHYIIHNEVDAHESWTHAGAKPAPLYTEIYQRSLRTVHYTIRKYNPTAKVFTSFTKHFNSKVNNNSFLSKEILDVLGKLSKKEGDFEWGIGWHSYPTNLFNPKVWNDDPAQTQLNFNTPQITPKNIEVIDAYVRQKDVLYKGKKVRTVILSENGFSSNAARNPNANETTQAAALAYFWKKTNNRAPSIEGIQLHRWIDNTNEAGLLFGLWTNKAGTVSDLGDKKEGWFVWNAAGTPAEDSVFTKYKAVIGINDWADINQSMTTEVTPYQVNMTLANCNSNLNELLVSFNGEFKRPQENGTIVFYNVASNVPQPYEVYKGNILLKKGVLNVNSDLNTEINVVPSYELGGKAISPTQNALSWKTDPTLSGYVIEAKSDGVDFQELARMNNTDSIYLHQGLIAGKEYNYRIAGLVDSTLSCFSNEVVVKTLFVRVEHKDEDKGKTANNQIKPDLRLTNEANYPVSYNSIKVRYWFIAEDFAPLHATIDYAQMGKQHIQSSFVLLDSLRDGANAYLELSFANSAGNIASLGNSGPIRLRINKIDWSNFNETNDYSYANNSDYALNSKITIYQNAELIYGDEPKLLPAQPLVIKAFYSNLDNNINNNQIKPSFKIVNEGGKAIDYKDLVLKYWFTAEGNATLQFSADYIEKLSGKINSIFKPTNGTKVNADHYLELGFRDNAGSLYGFSNSGGIQTRFNKSDWSNFNEANDYSYANNNQFLSNPNITLYYKGQLIFGVEPVNNSLLLMSSFEKEGVSFKELDKVFYEVYPNPAKDKLYFRTDSKINKLSVVDLQGKIIDVPFSKNGNLIEINTVQLSTGIYILQLNTDSNSYQKKFLINK